MIEPARTSLYRTFLICSVLALLFMTVVFELYVYAVLAAFWVLVLLASFLWSRRRVRPLRVTRQLTPSAFEDDTPTVKLVLENTGWWPATLIELRDRFGPALYDRSLVSEPGPLSGGSWRSLEYRAHCSRHWGLYPVGPLQLTTSDPLGLFHATRTQPDTIAFSVFPRVYELEGLKRLGARPSLAPQDRTTARPGQSHLYLGVREYRRGDDPRRIHWPSTARRGSLMVKELESDLLPHLTLFLDLQREHRAGMGVRSTLEYLVRTAASMLWSASRQGLFVQLFAHRARPLILPSGHGQAHLAFALYELIRVRQDGAVPLVEVALANLAALPPGSTAAFLFGTSTPRVASIRELVGRLRARGVRSAFVFVNNHSFVPVEKRPMPREGVLERHRELKYLLDTRGLPSAILDAGDSLEEVLSHPEFLT